ncbi:hypothetical protein [Lysobacter claricitrinus]|uniref:hypothetical protein n=1 Tax=Lysobacter claricitrinus TaxID=3367728 RepID=UPI0037DBCAD8
MPELTHTEYVQSVRREAAELAARVLAGEACILESSHRMYGLLGRAELPETDPVVETFRLVSSDIDRLPVGSVRQHWAPEALAELEPALASAKEWALPMVREACADVVQRFGA